MSIIKITNRIEKQVSTTIGLVDPGRGKILQVQTDEVPLPKRLYNELEELRLRGTITYEVIEDPDIRDETEGAPFFPGAPAGTIGEPTDGDISDGFFDTWTPNTLVADAFDDVSEIINDLVPAKAGELTGQDLVMSGTTLYDAKIPTSLPPGWPTAGSSISNLIYDNTYRLETPDPSTRFRAGKSSDVSTAGILSHLINGSIDDSYDIGVNGTGTIGNITVTALDIYNTFWLKANARIDFTQITEGRTIHSLSHGEAGQTNNIDFVYDDVNTAPSFSVAFAAALNTKVSKWLSGIEAWGFGTTIDISYTAASGIFTKAYHSSAVGQVSGPGHNTTIDNPASTPAYTDTFAVSRTISLDIADQASLTPQFQSQIQKPDGVNSISSQLLSAPVNTYGTVSTTKTDDFFDEARRIVLNSGTGSGDATPWTSTAALTNGNAQQRHNGALQYPDSTDYPGFTGDQEYQRFIAKVSASTGALTLTGINYTDIDPYGTGDFNVLIHLTTNDLYFDLGRSVGDNNGTGDGSSRANSIGARNDSTSSGSTLAWSIGTNSTAFNGNEYRLIIIFRNNNHSLSRISEV